jgi:hypothetical protein
VKHGRRGAILRRLLLFRLRSACVGGNIATAMTLKVGFVDFCVGWISRRADEFRHMFGKA